MIELKIDSDTPVYATYEIIFRFIAYSYYKINFMCGQISHSKNNSDYDLFSAKKIFLTVLAPKEYYDEYNLIVFEKSINEALKNGSNIKIKISHVYLRQNFYSKNLIWKIKKILIIFHKIILNQSRKVKIYSKIKH